MAAEDLETTVEIGDNVRPVKSVNDNREFLYFPLENGIRCVVMSDPQGDLAAASICVGVGDTKDPKKIEGLAHFLEHMLFLGTKKYPNEDEYSEFMTKNGGDENAWTSHNRTTYHFEVKHSKIKEGLDRLSQFFISPLFNPSATSRELNAINSEFENEIQDDDTRHWHILRTTGDPNHPNVKFGTGNNKTLIEIPKQEGIDIREALLEFYEKWYSPKIMTLAVTGREPVEELKEIVVELFSQIPSKDIEKDLNKITGNPYPDSVLRFETEILTVADKNNVGLYWFPPDILSEHYTQNIDGFVGHILGHEGPGSILYHLKELGWATELSAWVDSEHSDDILSAAIDVEMTENGFDNIDTIINMMLQFVELFKTASDEKILQLYEEYKNIKITGFRFKKKEEPQDYVDTLSQSIHLYEPKHILSAGLHDMKLDIKLFREFMTHFVPDKMRIMKLSQDFEEEDLNLLEPIYEIKYNHELINEETMQDYRELTQNVEEFPNQLHLPEPNSFVCTDFTIVSEFKDNPPVEKSIPKKIYSNDAVELWYKKDDAFFKPKVFLSAQIATEAIQGGERRISCKEYCLTRLYVTITNFLFSNFGYDAELAGYNSEFSHETTLGGLKFGLNGYREKFPVILDRVLALISNLQNSIDESLYMTMKEERIRGLNNIYQDEVSDQTETFAAGCYETHAVPVSEQLVEVENLTYSDFCEFLTNVYSNGSMRILITGDLHEEFAIEIAQQIEQKLNINQSNNLFKPQAVILEPEKPTAYKFEVKNEDEKNSCCYCCFQIGPVSDDIHLHTVSQITERMISDPFYHKLRTVEQLGYYVYSWCTNDSGIYSINFLIQSSNSTPKYLYDRIHLFLKEYQMKIEEICSCEKLYAEYCEGVYADLVKLPLNQAEEHEWFWEEIENGQNLFHRKKLRADEVSKVDPKEIIEFYQKYLNPETPVKSCYFLAFSQNGNIKNVSADENFGFPVYTNEREFLANHQLYETFHL